MYNPGIIENMSEEISSVLKKNLYTLLNPIMEEQNKTNDALLNFPIIKNLKKKIKELEEKLLENNCQKNIKIFELSQEIKKKNEKIESLEKQLNKVCSIKLEVKELDNNVEEVDIKSIDIMSFGKNEKIDNKPKPVLTNMWNLLDGGDDSDDEEYKYSDDDLENEEENEEDEEDEDEEEEEENEELNSSPEEELNTSPEEELNSSPEEELNSSPEEDENQKSYITSVLRAQKSDDKYATIDTDSEEEEAKKSITNPEEDKELEETLNSSPPEEDSNSDSEEELELEEIVINEIKYLTDSIINGSIYKCDEEGEIVEDDEGELITVGKYNNKTPELFL